LLRTSGKSGGGIGGATYRGADGGFCALLEPLVPGRLDDSYVADFIVGNLRGRGVDYYGST